MPHRVVFTDDLGNKQVAKANLMGAVAVVIFSTLEDFFTEWCHSLDINSFRFASALNPDSSICMNCRDSPWFFTVS